MVKIITCCRTTTSRLPSPPLRFHSRLFFFSFLLFFSLSSASSSLSIPLSYPSFPLSSTPDFALFFVSVHLSNPPVVLRQGSFSHLGRRCGFATPGSLVAWDF